MTCDPSNSVDDGHLSESGTGECPGNIRPPSTMGKLMQQDQSMRVVKRSKSELKIKYIQVRDTL